MLPPVEHPGIRLRDNRYQAVAAPSVAVEVAIPACAYSLPSHGLKGEFGGGEGSVIIPFVSSSSSS